MVIIFGTKRMRRNLGVVFMMCQRCNAPCAHTILRLHSWFTLFFIPVIPLGSRYLTVCSMCAGQVRIDGAQAEQLRQAALAQAAHQSHHTADGPISAYGSAPLPTPEPFASTASTALMPGMVAGAPIHDAVPSTSVSPAFTPNGLGQLQGPNSFCTSCGNSLNASHAFCDSCGSPVAFRH